MFTAEQVQDAYFAQRCVEIAHDERATAVQIAIDDIEAYNDETNQLDAKTTEDARRVELKHLARGIEALESARLVVGERQTSAEITLQSGIAPTILVPAGYIATSEAWRQVTLQLHQQNDELITIREAAELLGVGLSAVSNRIDRGHLHAYRDPAEPNPTKARRVLRSEVLGLKS